MKTYRVPVEFQAEDDEAARKIVANLYALVLPLACIVTDELAVQAHYWTAVPKAGGS
jgi:hypothetical protein